MRSSLRNSNVKNKEDPSLLGIVRAARRRDGARRPGYESRGGQSPRRRYGRPQLQLLLAVDGLGARRADLGRVGRRRGQRRGAAVRQPQLARRAQTGRPGLLGLGRVRGGGAPRGELVQAAVGARARGATQLLLLAGSLLLLLLLSWMTAGGGGGATAVTAPRLIPAAMETKGC